MKKQFFPPKRHTSKNNNSINVENQKKKTDRWKRSPQINQVKIDTFQCDIQELPYWKGYGI